MKRKAMFLINRSKDTWSLSNGNKIGPDRVNQAWPGAHHHFLHTEACGNSGARRRDALSPRAVSHRC